VSTSISIDVVSVGKHMIQGAVLAHVANLDVLAGILVGGLASAIRMTVGLTSKKPKELPDDLKDYFYLYTIEKDLKSN
jgi:hypothetical protein